MSHQNRSKKNPRPNDNPAPELIKALREAKLMSQYDFGKIGFYSLPTVIAWEDGSRQMHPLVWAAYKHMLDVEDLKKIPGPTVVQD